MIRITAALLVLGFAASTAKADDPFTHDHYYKDSIAAIKEMAEIIQKVKDKKTADEAKTKLDKVAKTLEELAKKGKALSPPSEEELKKLRKDYEDKMDQANKDLRNAINFLYGQKDADPVIDWLVAWKAKKPM